jgi:hypothetical protein
MRHASIFILDPGHGFSTGNQYFQCSNEIIARALLRTKEFSLWLKRVEKYIFP